MIPFELANDIGDRFLDLLKKNTITPAINSSTETELLSLTELVEVTKNPALATGVKQLSILRSAAGLHDLAAKVLSVERLPEFPNFIEHLRLIAGSSTIAASLGQNVRSDIRDDTARKIAELYMACLAAHVGTNVVLDPPYHSKPGNPDVLFDVDPVGTVSVGKTKWALAVKTISSESGQTIFENIKTAAKQIDDRRCPAAHGLVVINTKNMLDHDSLWSPTVPFNDLDEAILALNSQLVNFANSADAGRPQAEWDALFTGRTVRPILFLGQSLVLLPDQSGNHLPTPIKQMLAYDANGSLDPVGKELATHMNLFMQKVLLGQSGGPGRLPS